MIVKGQKLSEENDRALKARIDTATSNDRVMSSLLYQITKEEKKTGFTEEDKRIVEDHLYNEVKASKKEYETRLSNYDMLNYNRGVARDAREAANAGKDSTAGIDVEEVAPKTKPETMKDKMYNANPWTKKGDTTIRSFSFRKRDGKPLVGIDQKNPTSVLYGVELEGDKVYGLLVKPETVSETEGDSKTGSTRTVTKPATNVRRELSPEEIGRLKLEGVDVDALKPQLTAAQLIEKYKK
jgi:hypothetical protein